MQKEGEKGTGSIILQQIDANIEQKIEDKDAQDQEKIKKKKKKLVADENVAAENVRR